MAEKRKDNNGRVLRTGEGQRKDGIYYWSYMDFGKRRYVYAGTLDALRKKKTELQAKLDGGVSYSALTTTVRQLVERYIDQCKENRSYNTVKNYTLWLHSLEREPFLNRCISDVRISDCKKWLSSLKNGGKSYSSVSSLKKMFHAAFQEAFEDDVLVKNPFDFRLNKAIRNDTRERVPFTDEQCRNWLTFVNNDKTLHKWYPIFSLLLWYGMRVSELCGLTVSDVDFKNKSIYINKQLQKKADGTYYVQSPKTNAGIRCMPMIDETEFLLKDILSARKTPDAEFEVDGYSDFLLLTRNGTPLVSSNISNAMARAEKKYNQLHPDAPMPHIFPHLCRHTFCTSLSDAHMPPKMIAAAAGHANADFTQRVYVHANQEKMCQELSSVIRLNVHKWNT